MRSARSRIDSRDASGDRRTTSAQAAGLGIGICPSRSKAPGVLKKGLLGAAIIGCIVFMASLFKSICPESVFSSLCPESRFSESTSTSISTSTVP